MKKLILIFIVFTETHSFAQNKTNFNPAWSPPVEYKQNINSSLRVIIVDKEKQKQQPIFFINGYFINNLSFIKPEQIQSIDVIKRDTLIGNQIYSGQIHIKTKTDYIPKLISLAELRTKYTSFKEIPVVFMVDTDIINSDEENYFVDENNLLTIIVDKLVTDKDKAEIGLIKLLTKSKKNIDSRNNIILRGEVIGLK